jgi:hypothetical protein
MATGRLGTADLTAATDTTVYTCPVDTFSVVTVSVCNRGTATAAVRVALSASGTPSSAEFLEFDAEILAKNVLERTGIVLDAGKNIVVRSNAASCSVVVMGIETSTI